MKTHPNSLVALFGVLLAASSAQSAAIIPPQFLPGDKTIRLSAGDQMAPEIAAGGNLTLVAWQDKRSVPATIGISSLEWETTNDIYATRIDATGQLLDRVPLVVTQEAASQEKPQVAWNGTNWLVVFESVDINGTGFYYQDSLEAVRVSPEGMILDPIPIKIRNVVPAGSSWAIASDGTDWFLAFQESDMSSALDLLRITAAGAVVQGPKVAVASTYFLRANLRLAYANGVFLFTWAEFSDTKALRFDPALTLLDPAPFTLVSGDIVNDLASDGTQFYATWLKTVSFVEQVAGSRISTTGQVLDGGGAGVVISNNGSKPDAFNIAFVTWDGINFRVSWSSNSKLYVARVNPTNGSVIDPGGVLVPGPMSGPTASTDGGELQVAWTVLQNSEYDTLTTHVSPLNAPGRNLGLGVGAPEQTRNDVAIGQTGSMVVFRSDFSGTNRVAAQPLDLNGRALLKNPVVLDAGTTATGPFNGPSVAWNGSLYLATWDDGDGIVGQRINQDGTLVDAAPFPIMPGFGPTEVSALGETFLVIARQFIANNPELIQPFVSRVNGSTGAVLDPQGFTVGPNFCVSVSVTTIGSRWLTVFRSNANHDEETGSTYGAFVNADGSKGNFFLIYGPSAAPGNGIVEVAVASDGTNALALQSAPLTSTSETDLVGVIVNGDGTHRAAVNLTPWLGNQYNPKVAWNSTHYVAVFQDQINRFALFTLDQLDARSDLFGMRITADGVKVDPMGFVFSASPAAEGWPNVTAGNGLTLLTGAVMLNQRFDAYRIGYQIRGAGSNQWPVAVASANTAGGNVPLSVNFSSVGSTDLDGTVASYLWDFGDGTTSTQPSPQHTYNAPGRYVATLTVTDNLGAKTSETVSIDASAPNQLPVAKFVVTPPTGHAPLSVTLTSDGSYDPDGAIGNRHWTFSDGGDYWGATAFHTFSRAGTFKVTLTVFDNDNATGSTSQNVVVTP